MKTNEEWRGLLLLLHRRSSKDDWLGSCSVKEATKEAAWAFWGHGPDEWSKEEREDAEKKIAALLPVLRSE